MSRTSSRAGPTGTGQPLGWHGWHGREKRAAKPTKVYPSDTGNRRKYGIYEAGYVCMYATGTTVHKRVIPRSTTCAKTAFMGINAAVQQAMYQ